MTDYQNQQMQEGMRNPKNRFLLLFCHANDVADSWGCNWSFYCGVIMFSIPVFIISILDIYYCFENEYFSLSTGWFFFMFILRLFSDFLALIAIFFGFRSIIALNSTYSAIAYYGIVISFLLNTIFCVYCIISFFSVDFWKIVKWRVIGFFLQEPILLAFAWILFGNMVEIAKKVKMQQENATNV